MDELLVIFGFLLFAALIVFPFIMVTHKRTIAHEERKLELIARAEEAKGGGGGENYRKLEERVRVLERIATDSNHALASQIEELRDIQLIDDRTTLKENAQ